MFPMGHVRIRSFEVGLVYRNGELSGLLEQGSHWFADPLNRFRVVVLSARAPFVEVDDLDVIVRSGLLAKRLAVFDVSDDERVLVWVDGRFERILGPGLHAAFTTVREVEAQRVSTSPLRFEHRALDPVLSSPGAEGFLQVLAVGEGETGILHVDGAVAGSLPPGRHAFWKTGAQVRLVNVSGRLQTLDVAGQDVMTADKVTLRLNALVSFRVTDPLRAVTVAEDASRELYRDAQLALREAVGGRELDAILADKDALLRDVEEGLRRRGAELGLSVERLGIRDVILPGDMRELLNKVTEAKKAAEANVISRREETAAMRSQANTARLLAENPTLMRLRELEVLERVAAAGKLTLVTGEGTMTDRLLKLV